MKLGEGYKLVMGGIAADTIFIEATSAGIATGAAIVTGIAGVINTSGLTGSDLTSAQNYNRGRTGRIVVGDNAAISDDSRSWLSTPAIDAKLLIGKPLGVR